MKEGRGKKEGRRGGGGLVGRWDVDVLIDATTVSLAGSLPSHAVLLPTGV